MSHILFIVNSERLSISDSNLCITKDDTKTSFNIKDIEAVIIESLQVTLTPSAILHLTRNKIPLILCNEKHAPEVSCLNMYEYYNISKKILEQIKWSEENKINSWRHIIKNKVINQLSLLEYCKAENSYITKLIQYIENINICTTIDEICQQEAIAAREYFKGLFGRDFKRQNDDILNASLNYGYSLLRSFIASVIVAKGLHPSLGICHKSQLNNFNLADDIIEIYRPIVDYAVWVSRDYVYEMDKDTKKHLLQVVLQKVHYEDKELDFKRSVRLFIDNLESYFKNEQCLKYHKLNTELYLYE